MACGPLVELTAALLGPVFSHRRPGRAAGAAQHRGYAVPEVYDSAGQVRLVSIPARLAVSKSHARLVRMERARPARAISIIGNFYSARFKSAWDAVRYTAAHLEDLEARTRMFSKTLRESTLPPEVKEAASANLSTLATTTCFRTADGEFHGFEGSDDTRGCCFGNCTHVWNYETATAFLFPSFARSLRRSAFGYSMDDAGAIHFRQMLPDGKERSGFAAADGQMGQIIHAWLDWKISGDRGTAAELPGRAQRRRLSLPGFPADGTPIATA